MTYNVSFIGDYFVHQITVDSADGMDEDDVITEASELAEAHYGWDVESASNDIEVEKS